jgi:hypothetical protein
VTPVIQVEHRVLRYLPPSTIQLGDTKFRAGSSPAVAASYSASPPSPAGSARSAREEPYLRQRATDLSPEARLPIRPLIARYVTIPIKPCHEEVDSDRQDGTDLLVDGAEDEGDRVYAGGEQ